MSDFIEISSKMFLREDRLTRAEERFAARILNRAGAYVRNAARRSIRTRPGASPPGKPPHSHSGLLRSNILFAADLPKRTVYVGPRPFASKRLRTSLSSGAALLEFGGQARILVTSFPAETGQRITLPAPEWRPATYRARPYMAPALRRGLADLERRAPGEFPAAWRAAIV